MPLDPTAIDRLYASAADAGSKALLSFGGDGMTSAVVDIERECATVQRHGHLDLLVVLDVGGRG
ncbi:hypothetical protein [Streptomyces sp. NBC_00996]|uniref:hypothetical protein n=1 Tax=Streptomyces sp. NBC_00996 TaxID=2903710 RepID=UPI0038702EDB|nr:hypothetical protein OG390_48690 [Streptomyces sp. NBC_00996]